MLDMIKCSTGGAYYARGEWVPADGEASAALAAKGFDAAAIENAKTGTMAYSILQAHNTSGDAENLKIKFDAMASHDITFVPDHVAGSEKELRIMVHEVNHTQVEPEEILSESVYHYDRKKHSLSIC